MEHQFKLVQRYSKPGDTTSAKKWYASAKSNGTATMADICSLIAARSTASSADVKAVLDNLNYVIDYHLKAGRTVQLGELGNFRMTVRSEGAAERKEFSQSMLRGAKIVFTPGATLKETRITTHFTQVSERVKETPEGAANGGDAEVSGDL